MLAIEGRINDALAVVDVIDPRRLPLVRLAC